MPIFRAVFLGILFFSHEVPSFGHGHLYGILLRMVFCGAIAVLKHLIYFFFFSRDQFRTDKMKKCRFSNYGFERREREVRRI